ncbi:MAG: Pvc16 family protein [Chloroflexota bacterium]
MIGAIDDTLETLLKRGIPIQDDEIEITFNQPKREWSARLNRPTVNLFLYDLRENVRLRTQSPAWRTADRQPGEGSVTQARQPVPFDIHYLVTAWANDPVDEHRLLTRTLAAFLRYPVVPDNLIKGLLTDQPLPLNINIARQDELQDTDRMWGALDNELRPGLGCSLTIFIDPFDTITTPIIGQRQLDVGQSYQPDTRQFSSPDAVDRFWAVGGTIHSAKPLDNLHVTVIERGLEIPLSDNGEYIIGKLRPGSYTLEVSAAGRAPSQHPIAVPADSYDIILD